MKLPFAAALVLAGAAPVLAGAAPVLAEGDPVEGEKDFRKCRSCHMVASDDETFVKGGKTGPNLYGVIGRAAGSADFNYSKSLMDAGEAGLVWDEESVIAFIADPTGYLRDVTGDNGARSKMTLKVSDGADVAAFLATFSDAGDGEEADADADPESEAEGEG